MDRLFQLAFVLLALTAASFGQPTVVCSYFGEPHLVPFPTECEPIQNQYICQPKTSEVLVNNQYLLINTYASPIGNFPIVRYNLTIRGTPEYPTPCVIADNVAAPMTWPPTCPSDSPALVVAIRGNYYVIHKTENIQLHVDKIKRYFEIYVTQPFALVPDTEGVCVEWDCEFELYLTGPSNRGKRADDDDVPSQICDECIADAQAAAAAAAAAGGATYGPISESLIRGRREACIYDIRSTADPIYGQGLILALLRASIRVDPRDPSYQAAYTQISNKAQELMCDRSDKDKTIIGKRRPYCVGGASGRCLKAEEKSKECAGLSVQKRDEN